MARILATANRRRRRFRADQRAATAVEFALVAPLLIALLIAMIQTFLAFFAGQLLETVVSQSSRLILTGQAQAANMSQSDFANKVCAKVVILFNCSGLMIDVEAYGAFSAAVTGTPVLTFNAQGNVSNLWQYNPGGPGQIVVVRVMYQWPVIMGPLGFSLANLPNGNRLIMASAAFQNEP